MRDFQCLLRSGFSKHVLWLHWWQTWLQNGPKWLFHSTMAYFMSCSEEMAFWDFFFFFVASLMTDVPPKCHHVTKWNGLGGANPPNHPMGYSVMVCILIAYFSFLLTFWEAAVIQFGGGGRGGKTSWKRCLEEGRLDAEDYVGLLRARARLSSHISLYIKGSQVENECGPKPCRPPTWPTARGWGGRTENEEEGTPHGRVGVGELKKMHPLFLSYYSHHCR